MVFAILVVLIIRVDFGSLGGLGHLAGFGSLGSFGHSGGLVI